MNKRVGVAVVAAVAGLIGAAVAVVPGMASGSSGTKTQLNPAELGQGKQLIARMTGAAETPPNASLGSGVATIAIDTTTNQICWAISVGDIDFPATVAHIHPGAAGVAGPPLVTLSAPNPTSSGCTTDAVNAPLIVANPSNFYVNVHSGLFPAGEIRGQLVNAQQAAVFLPVPVRAYDSRNGDGKLLAGQTRTIGLATGKDANGSTLLAVPPGATAAIVNLTITDTEGAGFVKIYSAAITEPATSSINWSDTGQNLAVSTPVAVDGQGRVKLTGGVNSTNVVVDVIGYYI
jgi:hypothetical protein